MEYLITVDAEGLDMDFLEENFEDAKEEYAECPVRETKSYLDSCASVLKLARYYRKNPTVKVSTLEEYFALLDKLSEFDFEILDKGRTISLI